MFGGETALSAGLFRYFLPGAFFVFGLPVTPSARLESIQEETFSAGDGEPSHRVLCGTLLVSAAECAVDESMRDEVSNGTGDGPVGIESEAVHVTERRLQMPVIVSG